MKEGQSFWSVVYAPFISRDLTRDDLRALVRKGLERTAGNYKVLVELQALPWLSSEVPLSYAVPAVPAGPTPNRFL